VTELCGGQPPLWIVHVDDHTDLNPSMVKPLSSPGFLYDPFFGKAIDLADASSVVAAVQRGVVSKGNFLLSYLLAYPGCRTVHVGRTEAEQQFLFSPGVEPVVLGGRQLTRHSFIFEPVSRSSPWTLRQTAFLPTDLPIGAEEGGVWLDIDLDYFWNRYNGDSDRRYVVAVPNERDDVERRVAHFLTELATVNWLARVSAISVAVSPGFFPSEYWADAIPAVCNGIRKMLEA